MVSDMVNKLKAWAPLWGFLLSALLWVVFLLTTRFWLWLAASALVYATGRALFKDTMNLYQGIGPIYWITRDNADYRTPRVAMSFMRMVDPPYRVGRGVQFRWKNYTFQIGLSMVPPDADEYTPIMGRKMDENPEEIGEW